MKIAFLLIIPCFVACSGSGNKTPGAVVDSIPRKSAVMESLFHPCGVSDKEFSFEIDSCNCSGITSKGDTLFVDIFPAEGGEVQGHLVKIRYPRCDRADYLLLKHQNRYYTSSMGPDPVLDDWVLYNSSADTLHLDSKRGGFFIDTIPRLAQQVFPSFDTLDFYKAYKRAVGEILNSDLYPGNSKWALNRENQHDLDDARQVLSHSGVELHRIILELIQKGQRRKVIVFTYGHFG